jgi:acyl carrier protein
VLRSIKTAIIKQGASNAMKNMDSLEKFIITEIAVEYDKKKLDIDEDLLEKKIIDSLGIMKLIVFMEEAFDIVVQDEEIVPDNFQTLNSLNNFIERKIAKKE